MGKLKQYQSSGITMTGMQQFTNAPIQESLAANERLDRFLTSAGTKFLEQANVYASEQAVKDAIANPITKEQIDQARQTGGNPIDEFLKGGKTYNDAIKDVLSQQIAGELRLELDQTSADILEQVRLGKITNQGQVLQKLQEPISAHVEFLSGINPKIAEGYGAQATASARNYLNQADTLIRNQEEEKRVFNAELMKVNVERDYQNFLLAYPNATLEQKQQYKDVIQQMARDMSFSGTRQQVKLAQQLADGLQFIDDGHHAKAIAQKYRGKSILEVLNALPKDKSSEASYYMQSTDKDRFAKLINNELSYINSEIAARDKIAQRELRLINDNYLAEGQRIPPAKIKEMYALVGPGSDLIDQIDLMVKQSTQIEQLNKTSLPELAAERDELLAIKIDPNKDLTIDQNQRLSILEPYVKNMVVALKNDPVGLIGKRDGNFEELNLNDPDLANKVLARKQLVERNADKYGISDLDKDMLLFTKDEVNAFVNTYKLSDAQTRVAMLQVLDDQFGADNSAALVQLVQGGLPTTAELSSYFSDPILTAKFMSFDDEEEQKRLITVAKEKNTTYIEIRREIANQLAAFDNVVMLQNPMNKSIATQKLDNIKDALTYLAISEMQSGKSLSNSVKDAAGTLTKTFQLKDTYYVPTKYNSKEIDPDNIIAKAERIKDIHLADFNAVPFGSFLNIVDEKERDLEFRTQMVENGKWQNTADGTGLIYGITMADGSFGPIQNANGNFLTFKFDDASMVVPFTNIDITVPKGETVIERIGRKKQAQKRLTMPADELRILEEKKARGKRVFGLED